MKFLKENNISIKSYEDLEEKANTFLSAIRLINFISNIYIPKDEKCSEQEKKCQCIETKIEEKKKESFSLGSLCFWSKTEEIHFSQVEQTNEKEDQEIIEEVKNIDFNSIPNYFTLTLIVMEILKKIGFHKCPGISNAINWLSNIIPFNELNELIKCTLRVVSDTINGITHIIEGIKDLKTNKIISIINITTGIIEMTKVGLDVLITSKKIEEKKKK
jgi:hypothetical protein